MEDRLINIIEDHACICQTLDQICYALKNDMPMPNYIPVLHDALVTDQLSKICEELDKREVKKN